MDGAAMCRKPGARRDSEPPRAERRPARRLIARARQVLTHT